MGGLYEGLQNKILKEGDDFCDACPYRPADRQSREALRWLIWESHKRNIPILNAGNGREKKVCGVKVDGYCKSANDITVLEFQGCFFHGCPLCFKNRDTPIRNVPREAMGTRYKKTLDKSELIRQNGYIVKEM